MKVYGLYEAGDRVAVMGTNERGTVTEVWRDRDGVFVSIRPDVPRSGNVSYPPCGLYHLEGGE